MKSAYFCNRGMISILTVLPDGKRVEVGLIGKEGFSGATDGELSHQLHQNCRAN